MSQKSNRDIKILGIYLKISEYDQICQNFSDTTCRSLSEYCRKIILGKRVLVYYRNKSLDELTEAFVQFKNTTKSLLQSNLLTDEEKLRINQEIKFIKEKVILLAGIIYPHKTDNNA